MKLTYRHLGVILIGLWLRKQATRNNNPIIALRYFKSIWNSKPNQINLPNSVPDPLDSLDLNISTVHPSKVKDSWMSSNSKSSKTLAAQATEEIDGHL